jgi:autotransporter-associated beta strand protein
MRKSFFIGLVACASLVVTPSAWAQTTYTWTRGGNTNAWNLSTNWSPNPPTFPGAGDFVVIDANAGTTTSDAMALSNDRAAASILFTGSSTKYLWANAPGSNLTNARNLTLTSGILADETSGPAFVGFSNQTSWRNLLVILAGDQSITNNSANALSFGNPDNLVSGTYRPGSGIRTTTGGTTTVTFSGTGAGDIVVYGEIANGGGNLSTIVNRPGGTVVFNSDNSNSGSTSILAGTLRLGSSGTTGRPGTTGPITIAAGATLAINRSDAFNVPNVISGGGSLVNSGSGTVRLTGANTFTGTTTINSGTVQIGNAGLNGELAGDVSIAAGAGFAIARTGTVTIPGTISGLGGVTNLSSGLAILTGSSTYAGPTTVSAGTLQIGDGGTTGSVGSTSDVTVASGAVFAVNRANAATQGTDFPAVSGSGGFAQAGVGTTILSQANTYTGLTTVSAGTLAVSGNGLIGTGGLALASGGVFDIGDSSAAVYLLASSGSLAGTGTLAGVGKTLQVQGSFGPGTGIAPGTISLNGLTLDLSPSAASTFKISSPSYSSGSYDLVSGSGGAIFGGVLNLVFSGGPFAEQANAVRIFDVSGGLSGGFSSVTFSGLAEGQTATFDASTGFVTVVPEPTSLACALLGCGSAAFCQWCRRRRQEHRAGAA